MDKRTVEQTETEIRRIAFESQIKIDKIVIFGSRTSLNYRPDSDIDVILVSRDFENVKTYKRANVFYKKWRYKKLPEPEFICLTPREFNQRKDEKANIVNEAIETGVVV